MNLNINGHSHALNVDPETSLIFVLRNDLNLMGAKLGCGLEQCGSCVVLADGKPVYSCTRTVADLQGTNIETVEGLAQAEALHPVQQAFLEENAAQCGYCTAGIIMRVIALLRDNPDPSTEEVNAALDAHLCRCGAHPRVLRAVARAAKLLRSNR